MLAFLQPVVLAAASMDATGLFHDMALGAEATVSGLVAFLAAARALSSFNVRAYHRVTLHCTAGSA